MGILTDALPFLEFFTGLKGIEEQSGYDETARLEAIERHEEQRRLSGDLRGRVLPDIKRLGREQMRMLEGSGVQQKADVRRRAQTRLAGVQSNLQRRGFGQTTIGASMAKGFGEFEEDQLARVDEQVRQERLGIHGYWGLLSNQMDVDLTGQAINIEGGRQIPPQQSPWLAYSELAGRLTPAPAPPEPPGTDYAALGIEAGAKIGSALLLSCDPALKTEIVEIDHATILEKVEQLEVKEWEYTAHVTGTAGRHVGPMADQFKELFDLGNDGTRINLIDAFGVCLSAIKALSARVRELEGNSNAASSDTARTG